jgi:magnesium transporter
VPATEGFAVLRVYRDSTRQFYNQDLDRLPDEIIWIDLLNPTAEEKGLVEKRALVHIPTIDALSEIESSSRLTVDHGAGED